jgi:hypothetical protein
VLRLQRGVPRQQTANVEGDPGSHSATDGLASAADVDGSRLDVTDAGLSGALPTLEHFHFRWNHSRSG